RRLRLVENYVRHEVAVLLEPPDIENARDRNLGALFRKLELVLPYRGSGRFDGRQFIDAAKRRLITAGHEPRADTPDRDDGALLLQAFDDVLVELVGGQNRRLRKPALVEDSPGLRAQV